MEGTGGSPKKPYLVFRTQCPGVDISDELRDGPRYGMTISIVGATLNCTFQFSFIWKLIQCTFSTTTPWCKSKPRECGQLRDFFWTRSLFLSSDANFQRDILGWEPLSLSLSPRAGWNLSAFRGLPQLLVLAQEMEAFFRMVASWWEVFYSVNNSLAKHTLLRNTKSTVWKKKKKTKSLQALPRMSDITFASPKLLAIFVVF